MCVSVTQVSIGVFLIVLVFAELILFKWHFVSSEGMSERARQMNDETEACIDSEQR